MSFSPKVEGTLPACQQGSRVTVPFSGKNMQGDRNRSPRPQLMQRSRHDHFPKRLRRGSPSAPEPIFLRGIARHAARTQPSNAQLAAPSQLAQMQQVRDCAGYGYRGMIRICWAAGISTMLLEDLDSTNRLAVMKSASENAATSDAHAN
jgi:hypothetical protein